ncbi:hypothetical protein BKA70DRAFT_1471891 [Coprinopsis sp. MPI-PUGE-AT-0042]|nr:hypothetical protein BKA70DRAFT_1471891 [Coprinopsis sp. MPI-PUGE-AT-0042]
MTTTLPAQLPDIPPLVYVSPTPLPPNSWTNGTELLWSNAYDECLRLESDSEATGIIHARTLGYLLIYAPISDGRTFAAGQILECGGDASKLCQLAQLYQDHLLAAFVKKLPESPLEPENNFFFGALEEPAPTSPRTAKQAALRRDGFKSIVSGDNDASYVLACRREGCPIPQGASSLTNAAHIILGVDSPEPTNKSKWLSTVGVIFQNYGGIDVLNELDGTQIHSLKNILTLDASSHANFNKLMLWFEPDPFYADSHHFIIHAEDPSLLPPDRDRRATFANADADVEHDLPGARFLTIHAAVCRVALLSGAAELMDRFDDQTEDPGEEELASETRSTHS